MTDQTPTPVRMYEAGILAAIFLFFSSLLFLTINCIHPVPPLGMIAC